MFVQYLTKKWKKVSGFMCHCNSDTWYAPTRCTSKVTLAKSISQKGS